MHWDVACNWQLFFQQLSSDIQKRLIILKPELKGLWGETVASLPEVRPVCWLPSGRSQTDLPKLWAQGPLLSLLLLLNLKQEIISESLHYYGFPDAVLCVNLRNKA